MFAADKVKSLGLVSACLLVLGLSGCGANADADALIEEQIQAMNDYADVLENDASISKMLEFKNRFEATSKKLKELNLSDEESKKLHEKHNEEYTLARARLQKASKKKSQKN